VGEKILISSFVYPIGRFRMRYTLTFGYNGKNYNGYARQPDLRTIEGEIIEALFKTKTVEDFEGSKLRVASRTDKGVSALGNVLALNSKFREDEIIFALNAHLEDIWFYGIHKVDDEFNPRHAKERWYRYYLYDVKLDINRIRESAEQFLGTQNFSNFAKLEGNDPVRAINSIDVTSSDNLIILDFKAQSFLWHMIRRLVNAILEVERGKISREDIKSALSSNKEFDFGLASPEPLILMDVRYDFEFDIDNIKLKYLRENISKNLNRLKIETQIYKQMKKAVE
jgi:tRNA pseudouridine38-40 synthase